MSKYKLGIFSDEGDGPKLLKIIGDFSIKPRRLPGRPKAVYRHAAITMCEYLEYRRYGRRLLARERTAERFELSDERAVRRITKDKQNPLKTTIPDGGFLIYLPEAADERALCAYLARDAIQTTGDSIRISGRGWLWREGDSIARYGDITGRGTITRS